MYVTYNIIYIMLNFKDFILFIPLNVFNDIALCFDIFIQLRANQRLAIEYLLKGRLDSIAFAISIDRITLLILGQNVTLCCLLLLKLKVPNFDFTRYRSVVVRCCFKVIPGEAGFTTDCFKIWVYNTKDIILLTSIVVSCSSGIC